MQQWSSKTLSVVISFTELFSSYERAVGAVEDSAQLWFDLVFPVKDIQFTLESTICFMGYRIEISTLQYCGKACLTRLGSLPHFVGKNKSQLCGFWWSVLGCTLAIRACLHQDCSAPWTTFIETNLSLTPVHWSTPGQVSCMLCGRRKWHGNSQRLLH